MRVEIQSCYFDKSLDRNVDKGEVIEADEAKVERLKTIGITCKKVVEDDSIEVKNAVKGKTLANKKADGK